MSRRALWIGLAVVVGVVILGSAWAGWTAYQVNRDLSSAVDDATALRAAVEDGDDSAAGLAIERLAQHSRAAADRTDGLTWAVLTKLPVYGDDARGVEVVSSVIHDLAQDGVRPLVQVSDDLDAIMPANARVNVDALEGLQAPVSAGLDAFREADARLAEEDPSGYVERLRSKYRELARQVSDAAAILSNADTALQVLPTMLGSDGARDYLLIFQNNAEIRATGGLPGAVSVVRAKDGAVRMTKQVAASSFGRIDEPVLPLTDAEQGIYDTIVGTYFLDANLQPDFGRAAELWKARWEQVYPEQIDGVLSLDPVALSYILGATGPVQIGDITLDENNAVDELLHKVYLRYEDPLEQDRWFRKVARQVFDRVSSGTGSPEDLVTALARGVDERRILVHDFERRLQGVLNDRKIAGALVTEATAPPQVGVYVNDGTGGKMSYFLRYDVSVNATYCNGGIQGLSGHAAFVSDAPADATSLPRYVTAGGAYGTEPGSQLVLVYVYGPVGGDVRDLMLNGRPVDGAETIVDRGREVVTFGLQLKPRQKVDLTWRMKTGHGQVGDTVVSVTPSIEPGGRSSTVRSAC